jgi:predicted DNA-binding transcriptional regulator AlpA
MTNIELPQIPALLNYKTLHKFYGLSQSTISKMVMWGKFTNIVKVGRKNYFRKEDVETWIDAQTIKVGA